MSRIMVFSVFATSLLGASAPALAAHYDFVATTGKWSDLDNWDPTPPVDPPGFADTVTILAGKTCTIEDESTSTASLEVEAGGTLGIEANQALWLYGDSIIDGLLYMNDDGPGGGGSGIIIFADLELSGTGTISAEAPTYGSGFIIGKTNIFDYDLTVTDVTIVGEIAISADLTNNGTFKVTHADDTMLIGAVHNAWGFPMITGTGSFEVSAGELQLNALDFGTEITTWLVTGGTLKVHSYLCVGCRDFKGNLEFTGGTFDVDGAFCHDHDGSFSLSSCTIDVDALATAEFNMNGC